MKMTTAKKQNVGTPGSEELIHMIWPETGLHTVSEIPVRAKNQLDQDDQIELSIDFVTLSFTPIEFIQLASFLRMSIDELLERHPDYQRAVVNAFDIQD